MADIELVLQNNLNDEQRAAASDEAREVLALACAGSGKSRTLAYRIAWLIAEQDADPEGIVAFTFTEKAADSIKHRVAGALAAAEIDPNVLGQMYIGTIHSYCHYLLGQMDARFRQFEVLDANRLKLYLLSRFFDLGLQALKQEMGTGQFKTVNETSFAWSILNEERLNPEQVAEKFPTLGDVLGQLSQSLDDDEYIDFSLMQRRVVDALDVGNPGALAAIADLEHLLVDEYQDINPVQDDLIALLHANSSSLFVVGDDDQAIYGFRGADVSRIIEFDQRYPNTRVHTLGTNYRSTPAIVEAADQFAAAELGAERIVKDPQAVEHDRPRDLRVLWFDQRNDEATWIRQRIQDLLGTTYTETDGTVRGLTPADFAILMRSTRRPESNGGPPRHTPFTDQLRAAGIDFTIEAAGGLFDRPEVEALRSTFEMLRDANPNRDQVRTHFEAVIAPNYPHANFNPVARVLSDWGRRIHAQIHVGQPRQRLYPQQLVFDLLEAFGLKDSPIDEATMMDIGVFSQIMQDVESVYMSVDSTGRFRTILNFLQQVADDGYDSTAYEISQRPDAVTVATVHKMKGLEFPVVFVADVEDQRFPGSRRRYSGWLPNDLLQVPLGRGAYQSTRPQEARLFYTAATRAERFLYVTGSETSEWWKQARKQSSFSLLLQHDELSNDTNGLPAGLTQCTPDRRLEEGRLPTTFSDIKYFLRCPKDYQFRKVFGFSPAIADLFGFGMTVHAGVAKLHELYPDQVPTPEEAGAVATEIFHVKHVPQAGDPENHPGPYERARERARELVSQYAEDFASDFEHRRQIEKRFEIPTEHTVISGAIDLMLHEDQDGNLLDACVIDFKTMEGGEDPLTNDDIEWSELALQVQLYARAAREVLNEIANHGHVHLLKDNQRVEIPVAEPALSAAVSTVQWAVQQIVAEDFPMRPHPHKCSGCDFRQICRKEPEQFQTDELPEALHVADGNRQQVAAFSMFDADYAGD
ncbi:MAG: ATP-dependent DNA helicase [Gammaproteobacteria bacterium]|nr:ATP-dependent DNA helicase [Gammaproteobacteria bacterium]